MFDFVRNHMRKLQFILLLLILPSMGLLGIQGYEGFSERAGAAPAEVDGQPITQAEWDAAHREQVEQTRKRMPNADPRLFDTPEFKRQTLDSLVRKRVVLTAADKFHLAVTDDRLQRLFVSAPEFAAIRNADGSVNKELLASQGMSSEMFAARLRQELSMQQVMLGVSSTALPSKSAADHAVDAFFQQREVRLQRFEPSAYVGKVSPTEADLEKYYKDPAHASEFQAAEQAAIEFVVLDVEAIKHGIALSEDDLRRYYSENTARYSTPEERRASHILVAADKSLAADERAKARAKADELLAILAKDPSAFAELARKNSQDPGSAAKGGDLDFFGRGAMVKPFEDAVYGLKVGDLSPVVETDFGFHIIRLTGLRGGEKRTFEAARGEIEAEVRQQLAQAKFAEAAEDFTNLVYEQPDSLQPVIDKYKLTLNKAEGITRSPGSGAQGPIAAPKFLEALFSSEALTNKRNTPAVETAPRQLVSGRVVRYEAARTLPLADVSAKVRLLVAMAQSADMARKEGEARLAQIKQSPDAGLSVEARRVSRLQMQELGEPLMNAILGASVTTLPAAVGVDLGLQGYAVVRIDKVTGRDPLVSDTSRATSQYSQAWSDAETRAYYASLRDRFKARVNDKELAKLLQSGSGESR